MGFIDDADQSYTNLNPERDGQALVHILLMWWMEQVNNVYSQSTAGCLAHLSPLFQQFLAFLRIVEEVSSIVP